MANECKSQQFMTPSPLVLIVGFLGAGKTTLLSALSRRLRDGGVEPFVILNDHANARVDAAALQGEGFDVTPVSGSCICCDSREAMFEALESRRGLALVEANGTTDPYPLLEHLTIRPALRERYGPVLQVSVVDAWRWQQRGFDDELELLQVHTASHVVLNRLEAVDAARATFVRDTLRLVAPRAELVTPEALAAEVSTLTRSGSAGGRVPVPQAPRGAHAVGHAYVSLRVPLPASPVTRGEVEAWLRALPDDVTRAKGLFLSADDGGFVVFQRVAGPAGFDVSFSVLSNAPAVEPCAVLIGVRLDAPALTTKAVEMLL
jgi:G3E family GTPase